MVNHIQGINCKQRARFKVCIGCFSRDESEKVSAVDWAKRDSRWNSILGTTFGKREKGFILLCGVGRCKFIRPQLASGARFSNKITTICARWSDLLHYKLYLVGCIGQIDSHVLQEQNSTNTFLLSGNYYLGFNYVCKLLPYLVFIYPKMNYYLTYHEQDFDRIVWGI